MDTSKIIPSCRSRNHSNKNPHRHRRAYEAAGQLWPDDLGKHLRRAQSQEQGHRKAVAL